MKYSATRSRLFSVAALSIASMTVAGILAPDTAQAHGMGHSHGGSGGATSSETTLNTGVDVDGTDPLSEVAVETEESSVWGASLSTFWESKHVHYGVTEADGSSVYGTELSLGYENFSVTASGIFALENDWSEWNFTTAYTAELGPVFITPGFNFRWSPYTHNHGGEEHEEHDDHDHHDEHEGHSEDHEGHDGHVHREYGYELFVVVGTTAIPYVIPSVGFLWDLAEDAGGFMEFRLDGEIPVYRNVVTFNPYTSLGLNFGYNTDEYYGWNNFLYGANLNVAITRNIVAFGGIGQNVVMQAARDAGSSNEIIATAGVSFSF